jgi:hypothetical protein
MLCSKPCWAKAVSLSKVIDLRSAGFMRAKIASMTEMVSDSISRRPRSPRTLAFVAARQIAPEVLALVGDAIDEGVDGLEPQGPRPRSLPALSHPAICSGEVLTTQVGR